MYTCEAVLRNWGKIGELCFPNGETESPGGEINFPTSGKNEGKLSHQNSHLGNSCETGGSNEREMKFRFHVNFYFHSTVCVPNDNLTFNYSSSTSYVEYQAGGGKRLVDS